MKYKINDVVVLLKDLKSENLNKGAIGTVVEVFLKPNIAYEVEFMDEYSLTFKQITLLPSQISAFSK